MMRVQCRILLGPEVPFFTDATLRVRVLDVSRAGAGAGIAGETVLANLRYQPGSTPELNVPVDCADINPRAHYAASAHLDLDADGQVSPGDWITTESYPVITHGYPLHGELRLQIV